MSFFYVYIIASGMNGDLYIGYTQNLKNRLLAHNSGKNTSTKGKKPWRLIYFEGYIHKQDALGREQFLKKWQRWKIYKKATCKLFP